MSSSALVLTWQRFAGPARHGCPTRSHFDRIDTARFWYHHLAVVLSQSRGSRTVLLRRSRDSHIRSEGLAQLRNIKLLGSLLRKITGVHLFEKG